MLLIVAGWLLRSPTSQFRHRHPQAPGDHLQILPRARCTTVVHRKIPHPVCVQEDHLAVLATDIDNGLDLRHPMTHPPRQASDLGHRGIGARIRLRP